MSKEKIKGGYVLQPRVINNSDVMKMPPVTRELWFYLCRNVQWSQYKNLRRGQGYFNLGDIQEDLCWMVGYRKMTYSKPQLTKSLRRLREGFMIETARATHGLVITICNYDFYQDPNNYEGNDEGVREGNAKEAEGSQYKQEDIKKDKKKEIPYAEIVDILNDQTGRSFKSGTSATRKVITARWKEGFTLEDFRVVIESKVSQWRDDPKMKEYLRPETLFGTKFESYLNYGKENNTPKQKTQEESPLFIQTEEQQEISLQQVYGMDFRLDGSHQEEWQKDADRLGITIQEYGAWRKSCGLYSKDNPMPTVDYPNTPTEEQ